jgi:flagellar export protein FliJ
VRGFRLASVLRARNAQENLARGAVLRARQEAEEAADRVRRMDAAIGAQPRPKSAHATAFAATLWARQAMAADLSAAIAIAGQLNAQVDERAVELTDAATRRRTVEKLAERHAEALRYAEEEAAELEADDLTTSRTRGGAKR